LIYIVLHKEDDPEDKKVETKQSLLDLLKSDGDLRSQIFGYLAGNQ